MEIPFCIIGLGNPGKRYENTRHNVGKKLVRWLSCRWGIPINKREKTHHFGKGKRSGKEIYLLLPSLFMNESGKVVQEIIHDFGLSLESLLVIHDDADIPLGKIKVVYSSSAGGHKGVASVIEYLGSQKFSRLKIGIGREENKDLTDYVLEEFQEEEKEVIGRIFSLCEGAIQVWISEGIYKAMSLYNNRRVLPC